MSTIRRNLSGFTTEVSVRRKDNVKLIERGREREKERKKEGQQYAKTKSEKEIDRQEQRARISRSKLGDR